MKVLVIGSRIPYPLHDGGAIATYNMLKGFAEAGQEVTYLSLNTSRHFVDESTLHREFSFLKGLRAFPIDTTVRPLNALLNLFSRNSYNIERFYSAAFENMLLEEVKKQHFDIIHFEGLFVAKYATALKKVCDAPIVLRQHNVEFRIWETLAANEKNPIKKQYLRLLAERIKTFEKAITPVFDQIVTIAATDQEEMEQWKLNLPVSTIPGGFSIQPFLSKDEEIPHSVYHIGSMEWLPNRQAMEWFHQQIWPLVVKAVPDAQCYMAGKNMPDVYSSWESANFHVAGEVANAAAFAVDKQILIVPLLSASGIRIKTIEAMLQGKAVVTTAVGARGLPLVNAEHCMIAVEPRSFAEALIALMNDDELRKKISENGQALMERSFENMAVTRQWIQLYESLLSH